MKSALFRIIGLTVCFIWILVACNNKDKVETNPEPIVTNLIGIWEMDSMFTSRTIGDYHRKDTTYPGLWSRQILMVDDSLNSLWLELLRAPEQYREMFPSLDFMLIGIDSTHVRVTDSGWYHRSNERLELKDDQIIAYGEYCYGGFAAGCDSSVTYYSRVKIPLNVIWGWSQQRLIEFH